jgi:hypothetical protein
LGITTYESAGLDGWVDYLLSDEHSLRRAFLFRINFAIPFRSLEEIERLPALELDWLQELLAAVCAYDEIRRLWGSFEA